MQQSLLRMAEREPDLAGRLLVQALPAAAAPIRGTLDYRLVLDGLGAYRVSIEDGKAEVVTDGVTASAASDGAVDFELHADPVTLARLAAGASPLRLMLRGRLKIRGKRLRALKLRRLASDLTMRDIVAAGVVPDPELVYRALPYTIDPAWTRGHQFCLKYELRGDESGPGGTWCLNVDDGHVSVSPEPPNGKADATLGFSHQTWLGLMSGELTPNEAMRRQLTDVEGALYPVTLFGRWIERAEGRDLKELEREARQKTIQDRRSTWGSSADGASAGGQGDPGHDAESRRRVKGAQLLTYEELYALWERQNWKAHELDFSEDKLHWLASPTDAQENTAWSMASFYIGEERVAADLAPFVPAAPTGEIEVFLTTQLVDEARHAVFFDRFFAEVMALEPEQIRGRLLHMEESMLSPWREVFDGALRGIASKIQARSDDLDLFVEGITIYHMVIEGVLAMTGQRFILQYLEDHDIYPGFRKGFSLVEQDEHRHIAFGVRFLKEACQQEPKYRKLIERTVHELVPRAAHVFVPPDTDDPSDFVTYGYHSSELYGYAYRALKRRMSVIGVPVAPAEELMPGRVAEPSVSLGQVAA